MATLRLFASARDAAGTARDDIEGATVAEVLDHARARYGDAFVSVLAISKVWLNGEPADAAAAVVATDEVAVLPPVSGGSDPRNAGAGSARRGRPGRGER